MQGHFNELKIKRALAAIFEFGLVLRAVNYAHHLAIPQLLHDFT